MIAGASAHGELEKRHKQVIAEIVCMSNVVLFVDEIHTLIGAGRSPGAMDAANVLKPDLVRGKLKVISTTTLDEYRKHIETDKAFERRFQKIVVDEPDVESAIMIIRGIKNRFENHYRIKILDDAVWHRSSYRIGTFSTDFCRIRPSIFSTRPLRRCASSGHLFPRSWMN